MKGKKKSKLQQAQDKAQAAINLTNKTIEELGGHTSGLYESLTSIQELFDKIRNVPSDKKLQYEELKQIRLNWKQQAEKIEKDYQEAAIKNAGAGAAGLAAAGAAAGAAGFGGKFNATIAPVGQTSTHFLHILHLLKSM